MNKEERLEKGQYLVNSYTPQEYGTKRHGVVCINCNDPIGFFVEDGTSDDIELVPENCDNCVKKWGTCPHKYYGMKVSIVDSHDGEVLHIHTDNDDSEGICRGPIAMCPWCGYKLEDFKNEQKEVKND